MRNIKIVIEYDGTAYHGWQRQIGVSTVQQVLEETIGRITQEEVTVIGSGRTDAGVHALKQCAHFKTRTAIGVRNLLLGINSLLPPDVAVKELVDEEEAFHARYDVKSKIYMYQIVNAPIRPVLYHRYCWYVRSPLDTDRMEEALFFLKGNHDFSSFCGKKEHNLNCIRTLMEVHVQRSGPELIRLYFEADGFLRYMVRTIVGTAIEVARGKRSPGELREILESRNRERAGITAPPQGLFLMDVKY